MVEVHSLSRFKIVKPNEMLAPGKCAVCGKFSTGTYVDFGMELDFYGVVYLCVEDCFVELANLQGFSSPSQHRMALAELQDKRDELNIALDRIEALNVALDGLRRDSDLRSVRSSDVVDVEQSAEIEGSDSQTITEPEQRSFESVNESGYSDVLNDDSIKELLGDAGNF